jgi:hypothetical protein
MKNHLAVIVLVVFCSSVLSASQENKLDYQVINSSCFSGIKCQFDVQISRKATKDELIELANKLRKSQPGNYKRFFITYYLPGMEMGWATSHFDPNLKVEIHGLTVDQEKRLLENVEDKQEKVIGIWIDETPYISNRTSLIRKEDRVMMRIQFKDGSLLEKEMIETNTANGKKYEERGGNDLGEYYLLDKSGALKAYDREGYINTLRPVKK